MGFFLQKIKQGSEEMKEFIANWIKNNLNDLDSNVANVVSILSSNFWGSGNAWYDFAKAVSAIIEPIALTIITICFLIEFLKITIQMDILKWEYALKVFFKFVFAKVCIDVSFKLLGAIYATGAEWIASVGTSASTIGSTAWTAIETEINGYNFMDMLGLVVSMGLIFLAIWVVSLIVQVVAYARKFELVIYLAVAPLPCAFLPLEDGGGSRIPKKYILTFASICLQGLFIIMSIKLYGMLCNEEIQATITAGGNVGTIAGQLLIASLVLVMAVVKSSSWARSILDAM